MELILNQPKTPTICLNMIVKNESKIIFRLFDSVINLIDTYCICDTGSTDNTVQMIEDYFREKNITGKIVYEPFQNFCHNRNFALQACLNMSDYVLLMDADMVLEVKEFNKATMWQHDSYNILQGCESFYYQNLRIVKNNGLYKYVGVTHEYIDRPPHESNKNIEKRELFIRDIGDGGSKQNKFERDISLLLEGLVHEPNNCRYFFYLANSYHDSRKYNEAIHWYKKRIEAGGWIEEVWYSYYRIGMCYKYMDDMPNAFFNWLEGYNLHPNRLEGLYEAVHYCRNKSKHKMGMAFYNMCKDALKKNNSRSNYLFVHDDIYSFLLYYEYTILALYCGIHNINDEIVEIFNKSHGTEINNLLSNMKFYKFVLQQSNKICMDNSFEKDINGQKIKFLSSSSSMVRNNDGIGYLMNIRYVNYYITENGSYINCDKNIITINEIVHLDDTMQITKRDFMNFEYEDRQYIGIEDIRLYNDANKLLYIGTGYHKNNKIGITYGEYNVNSLDLTKNELMQNFKDSQCEKNWTFFSFKNEKHLIYNWFPLQICKLNEENNTISVVETRTMPKIFSRARGSTCGFEYVKRTTTPTNVDEDNIQMVIGETEVWFVCHLVSYENPRHYYHIICVFDANMQLLRYSAPFKFEGECIEYCLSILVEDKNVYMNYSTMDRTTRIGVYDKAYIESLLIYN